MSNLYAAGTLSINGAAS